MSSKSTNRDIYFNRARHCTNTAEEFVAMLEESPYNTHRRYAVRLRQQLTAMQQQQIDSGGGDAKAE